MEVVEIEEENYFFKLSAYQGKLLAYLSSEDVIVPEWRRQEAIQFVRRGLEDFSISRVREKMPWGVAVPDDDSQVMYVWFDALTNYISTLGWPSSAKATEGKPEDLFEKFWVNGETVQLAGKDQIRFQSIMWQAMLTSAGLPTTKQVVYHGFITSEGKKMSKSLGNVVDPMAIVKEYGADALRYFLARHVHPFDDSDFTIERFREAYNADLANGLGNLAARVMQLAQTNLGTPVAVQFVPYPEAFMQALDAFKINEAVEYVASRVQGLDQKINQTEPFKVVKVDAEKGKKLIEDLVHELAAIDLMLEPLIPETSKRVIEAIMANKKPENLFPRKE
jgi:methionyl-tRNA synthetase